MTKWGRGNDESGDRPAPGWGESPALHSPVSECGTGTLRSLIYSLGVILD